MPNAIKYNVSNQTLALKKGNFYIGTGDVGKGPTSSTDYYNGITPPSGGYTIYLNKASGGPSIYTVSSNPQLTGLTSTIAGQTLTTAEAALDWYNSQTDKMVFNIDYPAVVTSGLTLNIDAGFTPSYPTTGTTWYDVSSSVANATLVGNPVFSTGANDFGGCFIVDTNQKYINLTTSSIFTNSSYTIETWQEIDSIPIPQRNAFRTSISVVGQGPDFTGKIISIQWYTGNQISVVNQGQSEIASTSDAFSLNTWCQVVFTYNYSDNNGILYINGVQNASGAFTPFVGTNPTIQLGTALTGCENCVNWGGSYAINRFYNRVLSASEVLQNYNAEIAQQNALSTEYQAILNYATAQGYTLPSTNQRLKQNKLLIDLKRGGIWEKLDSFAMFATDGDSNFALIDWKRLSQYTAVNSPTFTTNNGFRGDGTSSYINTNFNISTGTNYKLNDASRNYWIGDFGSGSGGALDGISANTYNFSQFFNSGQRINSLLVSGISIPFNVYGWHGLYRPNSTDIAFSTTSGGYVSTTQTSQTLVNTQQLIMRHQNTYGGRRIFKFYSLGGNFTSGEDTIYYNTINTYLTSL
jgi:hypothetical protein